MLEQLLKSIKEKISKDNFLSDNINSYHLLEKASDAAYPSITIKNLFCECNNVISNSLFINNMKLSVHLESDREDPEFTDSIDKKLQIALNGMAYIDLDSKLEILFSLESVEYLQKKNVIEVIYRFLCKIIYKNQFFN